VTRALLLGATGMLGRAIARQAPAGVTLVAPDDPRIDVTRPDEVRAALARERPDWVINCAAATQVDDAERDPPRAIAVNAIAPGMLGECCRDANAVLLHFGSDYVFAGDGQRPYTEEDATSPVNRYGESKLAGERRLAESGAESLVVRTQWLFGTPGRSFPRTMWERARARTPSRVVDDQVGRPSLADDVAAASWRLLQAGARGVVHVANAGTATWFELAQAVYDAAGVPELVTPCATSDFPTPARRPAYSVLDTSRMERLLGAPLPSWRDALTRFLDQLRAGETATAAK